MFQLQPHDKNKKREEDISTFRSVATQFYFRTYIMYTITKRATYVPVFISLLDKHISTNMPLLDGTHNVPIIQARVTHESRRIFSCQHTPHIETFHNNFTIQQTA